MMDINLLFRYYHSFCGKIILLLPIFFSMSIILVIIVHTNAWG